MRFAVLILSGLVAAINGAFALTVEIPDQKKPEKRFGYLTERNLSSTLTSVSNEGTMIE